MTRVLVVVSHPDDEILGAGATLAKHALAGDEVRVLILGRGRPGAGSDTTASAAADVIGATVRLHDLPDNQFDTVPLLRIAELVEWAITEHQPEVIYTHHAGDLNVDHRRTHEAVLAACRPQGGCPVRQVLAFEVPSATEWGLSAFQPTVFVDVSGQPWARKRKALACYVSEMRAFPHPRSQTAISALAMWRGVMAGVQMAEAFELVRDIR